MFETIEAVGEGVLMMGVRLQKGLGENASHRMNYPKKKNVVTHEAVPCPKIAG
jgi:hypothetical protein